MNDQNQVEIDTDDVNEENVTVQEKPKEEKPENLKIGFFIFFLNP